MIMSFFVSQGRSSSREFEFVLEEGDEVDVESNKEDVVVEGVVVFRCKRFRWGWVGRSESESAREATTSSPKMDVIEEKGILSLVKLTRSGLLLSTFPRSCSPDTVDIVLKIFESLGSGNLDLVKLLRRIFLEALVLTSAVVCSLTGYTFWAAK
ncbi:hypothetical protein C5167_025844 [Papaver somniferum]|uniref:Uncharacterized protein n=1 Tax=Papaver somniferum TaxID=3469 RepID=A0A4Y7JSN0_PAPSO|nr:hypothetical protein C5167_025844 [Papaver somniferum]